MQALVKGRGHTIANEDLLCGELYGLLFSGFTAVVMFTKRPTRRENCTKMQDIKNTLKLAMNKAQTLHDQREERRKQSRYGFNNNQVASSFVRENTGNCARV